MLYYSVIIKNMLDVFLFTSLLSPIEPVRIAVIDTGYNNATFNICQGERDFTGTGMTDRKGHGQAISQIIGGNLKADYCIIPIKFYDPRSKTNNDLNVIAALKYLLYKKVDIINLSLNGNDENPEETKLIKKLLDKGVTIVSSAGNENFHISKKHCRAYPACTDDRVITVGALNKEKTQRLKSSNYGPYIKRWEVGEVRVGGELMLGTSPAAAIATAKIAKKIIQERKFKHGQEEGHTRGGLRSSWYGTYYNSGS